MYPTARFCDAADGNLDKNKVCLFKNIYTRYPVITLVLYFGYKKHWNKAKTLYDVFGKDIDEDLKPFIHDYKINLIEIAYLTNEQVKGFKSDFRFVVDYFVQMQQTGTYIGSQEQVVHIREVLQLLSALTNDHRFLDAAETAEKGDIMLGTMSEALDVIENRGIEKGIEKGQKQGTIQGENKLGELITLLLSNGRNEDVALAASDADARNRLYAEFGIK